MANKYNSEGYYSPTEFEAFTRIEKEEKAAAKARGKMPDRKTGKMNESESSNLSDRFN